MIDARTAVSAVNAYIKSFPDLLQLCSPRPEEAEVDPDTGDWLITLSAHDEPDLLLSLGTPPKRSYQQFRVRQGKGINTRQAEVVYMKIQRLDE